MTNKQIRFLNKEFKKEKTEKGSGQEYQDNLHQL